MATFKKTISFGNASAGNNTEVLKHVDLLTFMLKDDNLQMEMSRSLWVVKKLRLPGLIRPFMHPLREDTGV